MRNRRRIQRLGPVIVYRKDNGLTRAFRNIPGKVIGFLKVAYGIFVPCKRNILAYQGANEIELSSY